MNEVLEKQKKNELNRFVFEKINAILLREDEEPETLAENCQEFSQESEYEKAKAQEIRSFFLEIVEMSAIERKFVDLQAFSQKTWRFSAKKLYLLIRKYGFLHDFLNNFL